MDPIADMIIRIKNAALAQRDVVSMPQSALKLAIAEKLKSRGFIADVTVRGKKAVKTLELTLARTQGGASRVTDVKRVSRPGRRVYAGADHINSVQGGMGAVVLSTPKGVLFGDEARKERVGGEVLFEIW
jgi:small subunit ribosomal protein S8